MSRLMEERRDLGLTQFVICDLARIGRPKYQLAERGVAILSEGEIHRLAKVLGIKKPFPHWLLSLQESDGDAMTPFSSGADI